MEDNALFNYLITQFEMFEPAHIYDSVLKVSLEQWNLNQLAEFAFWVFISRTVFHILCHRVECFGALHMMCKRSKYVLIQSPDRRKIQTDTMIQ